MKKLILSNKQEIMVADDSYPLCIVVYGRNFSDVDEMKNVITEGTINGSEMDGELLYNLVFSTLHTSLENNSVRMEFIFRNKTEPEMLLDRMSELEDAVNFLLMGVDE